MTPASNSHRADQIRPYGKAAIDAAAHLVREGRPVAVPTETVYGLAADATNPQAVAAIYTIKARPDFNPLIVHVLDLAAAEQIAVFDSPARLLAERFWPGPLTLVLPLRAYSGIASLATAGLDTIAVRVPAHPAMRDLLAATAKPLAAPSANVSGRISPTRAAHVAASLGDKLALIIDAGPCEAGLESTILMPTLGQFAILRPGPITSEMICQATGVRAAIADAGVGIPVVPGQLASHYAPTKQVTIVSSTSGAPEASYVIGFGAMACDFNLSVNGNLVEAATRLFDALHAADASDRTTVSTVLVPDHGIGRAINDRLRRAAA